MRIFKWYEVGEKKFAVWDCWQRLGHLIKIEVTSEAIEGGARFPVVKGSLFSAVGSVAHRRWKKMGEKPKMNAAFAFPLCSCLYEEDRVSVLYTLNHREQHFSSVPALSSTLSLYPTPTRPLMQAFRRKAGHSGQPGETWWVLLFFLLKNEVYVHVCLSEDKILVNGLSLHCVLRQCLSCFCYYAAYSRLADCSGYSCSGWLAYFCLSFCHGSDRIKDAHHRIQPFMWV